MGLRWLLYILATVFLIDLTTSNDETWSCPEFEEHPTVECSCDLPHTLRCTGDRSAMQIIGRTLRSLPTHRAVSLLDCTVQNVSALGGALLEGVALHGLVVSSGEIRDVHSSAFKGLASPLQALGLPNNQLTAVPTEALAQLEGLDRLDLSHNKLKNILKESFKGLTNLTFLELSENQLAHLTPGCFQPLKSLSTLRLRGNNLSIPNLSTLRDLSSISELDLTKNSLSGPLGPNTLPSLKNLRLLQLGNNEFTSIKRGALAGLVNLTSLSLKHNQIDVIEDYAFRQLSNLTELDLAHNGIVAVSGNSLAHLNKLQKLDLSHNFLRALTADLIKPLRSLRDLRLDDNDISIVTEDSLSEDVVLDRFTLSDNPLNCDCSILEFSTWLRRSYHLSTVDKRTVSCTTPRELEGALLLDLQPSKLGCNGPDEEFADDIMTYSTTTTSTTTTTTESHVDDSEHITTLMSYTASLVAPEIPSGDSEDELAVSKAQITLVDFDYDGVLVKLSWSVEAAAIPYTCDAVFVYEELHEKEVLLSSEPLHCDSVVMADPSNLHITVPGSRDLKQDHKYRYCIALMQGSRRDDELSLVLGCSETLPLRLTKPPALHNRDPAVRVSGVRANVTTSGLLSVEISLFGYPPKRPQHAPDAEPTEEQITEYFDQLNNCYINMAVFAQGSLIAQRDTPCDRVHVKMEGFLQGPYRVCVSLSEFQVNGPNSRCVSAQKLAKVAEAAAIRTFNVALVATIVGMLLAVIVLIWAMRKLLKKPKSFHGSHQCFRPDPQTLDEEQHTGYVKLHATTKV